jgi:hypothetical protein
MYRVGGRSVQIYLNFRLGLKNETVLVGNRDGADVCDLSRLGS